MTPGKAKFEIKLGAATREAFGKALAELGRENRNVVALDADLSKSTFTSLFGPSETRVSSRNVTPTAPSAPVRSVSDA